MTTKVLTRDEAPLYLSKVGIKAKPMQFFSKSVFNKGGKEIISLYENECREDFFFQKVKKVGLKDYEPTQDRIVIYKIPPDSNYQKRDFIEVTDNGVMKKKYYFCTEEASLAYDEQGMTSAEASLFDATNNVPYSQMTVRDYACIQLRIPKSGYEWLNNLIKESKANV